MHPAERVLIWLILIHDRLVNPRSSAFPCERERGSRLLTGQDHCDHSSRSLVEDIVAQHKNRADTSVLMSAHRVRVRPANVASQYSGHVSVLPAKPSSASARSSFRSSFAHSRTSRVFESLSIFSATAASIAWLRLGKCRRATRRSSSLTRPASSVTASLVLGMPGLRYDAFSSHMLEQEARSNEHEVGVPIGSVAELES